MSDELMHGLKKLGLTYGQVELVFPWLKRKILEARIQVAENFIHPRQFELSSYLIELKRELEVLK